MKQIPFNRSSILGSELEYIRQAIESGVISGEGTFANRCHRYLENLLGGTALLTPSCTDALEMCALLLDLSPEDEVIMPSFTFVSTASAFALRGARIRFADVLPHDLNIDPDSIEACITERTKAIVVVHYGGVACDMERICAIAAKHSLAVIEDAAHALGAAHNGTPLGSFGALSAFSFHETKNVTCGEGGALIVRDPALEERANIIRDKGTNRRAFKRGDAAFYSWVDLGSSFVMSDILAAYLFAQLEHLPEILAKRRALCAQYAQMLEPLAASGRLQMGQPEALSESGAHLWYVIAETPADRLALQNHLRRAGIDAVFHYQPLHQSAYVRSRWGIQPHLPVTEQIAGSLLRLPLYYSLTETEVTRVCECIENFYGQSELRAANM